MDLLSLPYLVDDDTIQFALERMKQTESRAIVVSHGGSEFALYMNRSVVQAWHDQVVHCKELRKYEGEKVAFPNWLIEAHEETHLYTFLEQKLDEAQATFGLLSSRYGSGVVSVITRREDDAARIFTATRVCACTGQYRHQADSPPKSDGQECARCSGTYECY